MKALRSLVHVLTAAFAAFATANLSASAPADGEAVLVSLTNANDALVREARQHYLPARVVAGAAPGDAEAAALVPLLRDRGLVDGKPAAYVCRNFACRMPVTDVEALRAELGD